MSNAELSEAVQAASDITSRTALMGIMALGEALQSAQLSSADLPHLALVGGTTVGNMDVTEVEFARTLHADTLGLCGMCTDQIAAHFGEWGYITTLSTACSSAANAFIHGAMLIESGRKRSTITFPLQWFPFAPHSRPIFLPPLRQFSSWSQPG